MSNEPTPIIVTNNTAAKRYEAVVDGHTSIITYHTSDGEIALDHTEVPPELRGRSIADQLAVFALNDARERGLKVVPNCPFVAKYIRRHTEYRDLVPDKYATLLDRA